MTMAQRLMFVCVCLFPSILYSSGAVNRSQEATYQLIYQDIQDIVGCYRRFNGTHEIGCNTGMSGNVGVIHYINSTESLNWLLKNGTHQPYIPLITSDMFVSLNVKKLRESEKINGMMVIQTDVGDTASYPKNGFSPDLQCPNDQSSIYSKDDKLSCSKHQFNPSGNGLMFEDWSMPVMLLKSQSEVDKIISCYTAHNLPAPGKDAPTFPLCSAELKAFMHGAGNSKICFRRNGMARNFSPDQYCQPLGGSSSTAFLAETTSPEEYNKTIVVMTRIDSFSLFEYAQPGTSTPAAGMATLLAVAEALRTVRTQIIDSGYNVLFLALTGESFDYIGSQRLIYDMKQDSFPNKTASASRFRLSDIDLIIELSHFIDFNNSRKIFAHTDPKTKSQHPNIQTFIQKLIAAKRFNMPTVAEATAGLPLPPSSSQMFLREDKDKGMPVIVLADFDTQYKTKYYNSYLDTPEARNLFVNRSAVTEETKIDAAQFLADVSTLVTTAIFSYATNNTSAVAANVNTTNSLLYCLLVNPQCDIFYTVINSSDTGVLDQTTEPFPFYVSVYYQYASPQDHIQILMLRMLAFFTGVFVEGDCEKDPQTPTSLLKMNGPLVNGTRTPICVKTTAQYHNASSPVFYSDMFNDYDFSSNLYSTWTESVWPSIDAFHVRIFLMPSSEVELACMVAGITIFILSAVMAVLIQRRAAILFPPHTQGTELITPVN